VEFVLILLALAVLALICWLVWVFLFSEEPNLTVGLNPSSDPAILAKRQEDWTNGKAARKERSRLAKAKKRT
jgi:hypothetical protein